MKRMGDGGVRCLRWHHSGSKFHSTWTISSVAETLFPCQSQEHPVRAPRARSCASQLHFSRTLDTPSARERSDHPSVLSKIAPRTNRWNTHRSFSWARCIRFQRYSWFVNMSLWMIENGAIISLRNRLLAWKRAHTGTMEDWPELDRITTDNCLARTRL